MIIVIISGPGAGLTFSKELIEEEIRRRENLPKLSDIEFVVQEKPLGMFDENFLKIPNIPDPAFFKPKDKIDTSAVKHKFPKIDYKIKHYKYIPNKRKGHLH